MIKRVITVLVVLAVLIGGGAFAAKRLRSGAGKEQNQYRIAAVQRDTVKKTVTATGVLKPWTVVDIKSRAGGRIDRLAVDDGTIVTKGQLIAQIDPSDTLLSYNSAKADIDSNAARIEQASKEHQWQQSQTSVSIDTAKANLRASRASAEAAKARYESAQKQAAAQGDLTNAAVESAQATLAAQRARLNQMKQALQPQQSAQAQSNLRQAEANLKNAEAQLNRQKALVDKGFVAASVVDQAQATYDVAYATAQSAREKMNTIEPELKTDLRAQEATVKQAEANLRQAEANRVDIALRQKSAESAFADYQRALADVKQSEASLRQAEASRINNDIRMTQIAQARASRARAQASLVNAKDQLDQTRVAAPSDGVVLKKYVEEGTLITSGISFNSTGTSIVQMGDTSRMYVDVQVDETDVASVDLDQKVDITFDSYSTTPFEGKVIKIDPQAVVEQNVTTVHVRVEVDNTAPSYRLLKPGMNATCEFIVAEKDDVVAVPNEAVKTDDEGNRYVEVAEGGKPAPPDAEGEKDPNLFVEVKLVKKPLQVELEGNDMTEVIEGVKEGDKIVTQTIEPQPPTAGGNPFGGSRGPGRR